MTIFLNALPDPKWAKLGQNNREEENMLHLLKTFQFKDDLQIALLGQNLC